MMKRKTFQNKRRTW